MPSSGFGRGFDLETSVASVPPAVHSFGRPTTTANEYSATAILSYSREFPKFMAMEAQRDVTLDLHCLSKSFKRRHAFPELPFTDLFSFFLGVIFEASADSLDSITWRIEGNA